MHPALRLALCLALSLSSTLAWAEPATGRAARQSPGHPQTLASPHVAKEHGGLDVRVKDGRVVVRSYVRRGPGAWAIEHRALAANVTEDAGAAAAREAFHQVRRAMIVHGHWKLGDEKIVDAGFDEVVKGVNAGVGTLSALYAAATDRIVKELKALDPWARIQTQADYIARTTPASNNVTAHRLPGDLLEVKIRRFRGPVAAQLRDELAAARAEGPVRGLILDLRGNGGGSVNEAHALLSQFLPDGKTLLTTEFGRLGHPIKRAPLLAQAPTGGADTSLPIAVLVNGRSASASELTVGVLKDSGRAQLFGDKTYGKGVGQMPRGLPDGRIFLQTEWRRVLPSLGAYHGIGISPDVDTAQAITTVDAAAQAGVLRARGDKLLRAAMLSMWPKAN